MTKYLLLSICLLTAISPAFSQTAPLPRSARFSQEIGLDFAPFVHGHSGASLLYKHSLGKTSDLQRKKRLALRLQLGYYEDPINSATLVGNVGSSTFYQAYSGRSKHQLLRFGIEDQISKKNFRVYFGADLGYRRWTELSDNQSIVSTSGQQTITDSWQGETTANVAEASVLAGVNYFFLPRFSVGLETAVSAGMESSEVQTIRNGSTTSTNNNTLFEIKIPLIRLLYLSYHFGK